MTEASLRLITFLRNQRGLDAGPWARGVDYAIECIEQSLPAIEAEARAPLEDEIARLRKIEDAARDAVSDCANVHGGVLVMATRITVDALRAALEEKPGEIPISTAQLDWMDQHGRK